MSSAKVAQMARRKRIQPVDLSDTITALLNEYGEAVFDVMEESVKEVTDEATKQLKAVNHWANEGSGAYASGWTNDTVEGRLPLSKFMVVYNGEHYRLTHLLENGHVIRNGTGRTFGKTGKYPHISKVNDWANTELPAVVRRKLGSL